MVWDTELEELNRRRELAQRMGGPERIARQHSAGKLTVRERIDALLDPGTFEEVGVLAGQGVYQDGQLMDFTPDSHVAGLGEIDGRPVVVAGSDFTIRGGSATKPSEKGALSQDLAIQYKLP